MGCLKGHKVENDDFGSLPFSSHIQKASKHIVYIIILALRAFGLEFGCVDSGKAILN